MSPSFPGSASAARTAARPMSAKVIDDTMQQKLNHDKIQLHIENEHYLRKHPEIRHIMDYYLTEVLKNQPENVQEFTTQILSDEQLKQKVDLHLQDSEKYDQTLGRTPDL
ncbi:hypothetical protein DFS34DRAFT_653743 [Phlyctochytrium arcticum]|nr:hypothetical protein DFS34DRAFT_653743 [Phlyctochytrium arcticum]